MDDDSAERIPATGADGGAGTGTGGGADGGTGPGEGAPDGAGVGLGEGADGTGPGPREGAPGGAGQEQRARAVRPVRAKSEQTRALILETALGLFQERGYDRTTMRAIAQEAGVSVGNAYYYFGSKEHLIQGFYDRMTREHAAATREAMEGVTDLGRRLDIALTTWLDCSEPYHEFAAQFFRNAADPDSPLSPFSAESHPARATSVELFREVLAGSELMPKLDAELAELLPEILWLHQMAVVLFWVFDRSPGCTRSRAFVKRCTPLVNRLLHLSRYRLFRPLVREAKDLIRDFVVPSARATTPEDV